MTIDLICMAVNDRKASSRHLAARRRRLLHRGLRARVPLHRIPLTANHRQLRLQWVHKHKAWKADWHQVVFSDEPRFNLWDHDGRISVRRYAGERCLSRILVPSLRNLYELIIFVLFSCSCVETEFVSGEAT
ncbi:transposable element Tcb2 transposase [Trichonephila clavipes]|nr:transposable element Tcb2 transposase [Trichonephila clavipes]